VKKFGSEPEIVANQAFKSEDHKLREMQKQIRDLQEENGILKKAMHFFAEDILKVSRSGYYKWKKRPESERERQHKEWTEQIKEAFDVWRLELELNLT